MQHLLCLIFPIAKWIECLPGVWDIMAGNLIGTQRVFLESSQPVTWRFLPLSGLKKIAECGDQKLLYIFFGSMLFSLNSLWISNIAHSLLTNVFHFAFSFARFAVKVTMKSCFYCVMAVTEDITRIAARLVACLMYLFTDLSIMWVGFENTRHRVPYKVKLLESPFGMRMQALPLYLVSYNIKWS